MANGAPVPRLRGRESEREALDRLVEGVRAGQSPVLVLRGEPGVGKTALLDYLVERASGCRIARAAGVESEMELAFAGLHQLCAPFLGRLERLPGPQRDALAAAFGLQNGGAPDQFMVGLAVLSLLSDATEEQPLLVVVDDVQWLDRASAQVLAFVARRLEAESVAIVFAERHSSHDEDLTGLPELELRGLAYRDARALLQSAVTGPLDDRVSDRIVAETRGTPLALLELPRGMSPEQLAGGFGWHIAPALPGRIEESFRRRLTTLPTTTRRLLLVAAAEPVGDPVLIWRAAGLLGVDGEAAEPAITEGLVEFDGQVRFRHPLVRSAAYRAASAEERHSVHHALAEATDASVDPDRRAWHRAQATARLDENVAAELEQSAGRARRRGGLSAAAAFLERAAGLTPDPARRARRALDGAQTKHEAGASDAALRLLAMAEAGQLDELGRARADLVRARITFVANRGRDAPPLLLRAARRLEPLDATLARETYRDAFYAAFTAGRLATGDGVLEVAEAARTAPPGPQPQRAPDLLLRGLALLIAEGYNVGAPILKRALSAFRDGEVSTEEAFRWLPLASRVAHDVWDDESWHALSTRLIELGRQTGALAVLRLGLLLGVGSAAFAGDLATAASMADEAEAVAEATGNPIGPYAPLVLAAWRGQAAEAARLDEANTSEMVGRGEGQWLTATHWTTALLNNGLARYDQALAAAEQGSEYPDELGLATWSMVELIEAAARTGSPERATTALRRVSESTTAGGTDWALGIRARSRALLSKSEAAEPHYREAVERLGRTRMRFELARARLVYGEWLRRERRRVEARKQLRAAHDAFSRIGAEGFAERTRRELLATGETVRKRDVETRDELTAQEAQIAGLAGERLTNDEISAKLFLSPRTVEWHLTKVFAKLGIGSRRQLRDALSAAGRPARAA
jgi:DNA-binding CsgD family transcriptional regulator